MIECLFKIYILFDSRCCRYAELFSLLDRMENIYSICILLYAYSIHLWCMNTLDKKKLCHGRALKT